MQNSFNNGILIHVMSNVIKLNVIPKTTKGNKPIFKTDSYDLLDKGIELVSYACGKCGCVIVENVVAESYSDVILQCPFLLSSYRMNLC
jgi:hypothetical protein